MSDFFNDSSQMAALWQRRRMIAQQAAQQLDNERQRLLLEKQTKQLERVLHF